LKRGYIIILILLLFLSTIIYYKLQEQKKQERYNKRIEQLVTDIRRRDYFHFHTQLEDSIAKRVSIDEITKFMSGIKVKKSDTIALESIKEANKDLVVRGTILTKEQALPFNFTFQEQNSTLLLLSSQIGNSTLQDKNLSFPLK